MQDIQVRLGGALMSSLTQVRQQKGTLSLGDIGGIFMQVASNMNPSGTEADRFMQQEISRLAQYISTAKQEIFTIAASDKSGAVITDASQHLDEVIKETEVASHAIMDAADAISASAIGLGGEKEQKIMDAITRIYEACNFQDVNGQRINKVIKLLGVLEEAIGKLNMLFSVDGASVAVQQAAKAKTPANDHELLNGPQLAANAPSQADVDALFASLGEKN